MGENELAKTVVLAGEPEATPEEIFVWEVIVIQAKKLPKHGKSACTIKFGDKLEKTHAVDEEMPLWNLWLQMGEEPDVSVMTFTLWDESTVNADGQGFEVGSVDIDLEGLRKRPGKPDEKWFTLYKVEDGQKKPMGAELHLSLTFEGIEVAGDEEQRDCRRVMQDNCSLM